MDYDNLLNRARSKIPQETSENKRFNPPALDSFIQGNRTVINNMNQLANYIHRDIDHIVKFLAKELATSSLIEGNKVILNGKFYPKQISDKIESYLKEFVICKECKKPDTQIIKDDKDNFFIKCMACQAKRPMPKVI